VVSEREQQIADVLAGLFYEEMAVEPGMRRAASREELHRLLFGMIANRMTRYEDALALPKALCERAGATDILDCLLQHNEHEIAELIAVPRALHRYPARIAKSLCASARQLRDSWNSELSTMWRDDPLGSELVNRLMTLHGVGPKIGNLMVRCLMLGYSNVSCWDGIATLDISPDRHALRVFRRLGLIRDERDVDGLLAASRRIRPYASVECDGAWSLALTHCRAGTARCRNGEGVGPCPLLHLCPSAK